MQLRMRNRAWSRILRGAILCAWKMQTTMQQRHTQHRRHGQALRQAGGGALLLVAPRPAVSREGQGRPELRCRSSAVSVPMKVTEPEQEQELMVLPPMESAGRRGAASCSAPFGDAREARAAGRRAREQQRRQRGCWERIAAVELCSSGAVGEVAPFERALAPGPKRPKQRPRRGRACLAVDDPNLRNPLKRAERLSTGWFGAILELEGVLLEGTHEAHTQAWLRVASEFGFPKPLGHLFRCVGRWRRGAPPRARRDGKPGSHTPSGASCAPQWLGCARGPASRCAPACDRRRRTKGLRDEVVVTRVFNWTQNPTTARQIAKRKQAIYDEVLGGRQPAEMLEARPFLETLRRSAPAMADAPPARPRRRRTLALVCATAAAAASAGMGQRRAPARVPPPPQCRPPPASCGQRRDTAPTPALPRRYQIPVALACALPEQRVSDALKRTNLRDYFDAVVTAEDSGAPEVEYYLSYAAQQIQRPPMRCVVFGESNTSVEAAHELGMKSVVVTGNRPVYDFVGADLVVRNLSQVTLFNLKRLFSTEDLVASRHDQDEQDLAGVRAAPFPWGGEGAAGPPRWEGRHGCGCGRLMADDVLVGGCVVVVAVPAQGRTTLSTTLSWTTLTTGGAPSSPGGDAPAVMWRRASGAWALGGGRLARASVLYNIRGGPRRGVCDHDHARAGVGGFGRAPLPARVGRALSLRGRRDCQRSWRRARAAAACYCREARLT